jgi:hypothetical protein
MKLSPSFDLSEMVGLVSSAENEPTKKMTIEDSSVTQHVHLFHHNQEPPYHQFQYKIF